MTAYTKSCIAIRKYQHALGYSENWMTEYVYNIVLLAKKGAEAKRINSHCGLLLLPL